MLRRKRVLAAAATQEMIKSQTDVTTRICQNASLEEKDHEFGGLSYSYLFGSFTIVVAKPLLQFYE